MSTGKFITFEGTEGVGKSTQAAFAAQLLRSRGYEVVLTREPGGTPLGDRIRDLLLRHDGNTEIHERTELLLVFCARLQHLQQLILPALRRGALVVCDRFTDSTYAYQGGGRGIGREEIRNLENWVQQGLKPDLTVLLDASIAVATQRADRREGGASRDRFEAESGEFFQRVREAFHRIAQEEPGRVKIVDAGQSLAAVQAQVAALLDEALS